MEGCAPGSTALSWGPGWVAALVPGGRKARTGVAGALEGHIHMLQQCEPLIKMLSDIYTSQSKQTNSDKLTPTRPSAGGAGAGLISNALIRVSGQGSLLQACSPPASEYPSLSCPPPPLPCPLHGPIRKMTESMVVPTPRLWPPAVFQSCAGTAHD